MNKKAVSLSVNTIIIIALGLLVLFVLFYVLQSNILGGSKRYMNLSLEAEKDIRAENVCEKLFSGRQCLSTEECSKRGYVDLGAGWIDCDGLHCCENP